MPFSQQFQDRIFWHFSGSRQIDAEEGSESWASISAAIVEPSRKFDRGSRTCSPAGRVLTRDRPGGRIRPPQFPSISSIVLHVSTPNLACLFVSQFYVVTQNFGKFYWKLFELYQCMWTNAMPFLVETW